MDNPATIASQFRQAWSVAFRARDVTALAALYTQDALFFGSTAELYRGREGVLAYFSTLQRDVALLAFEPQDVIPAGPDTIVAAGYWQFRFGSEARPYRLTWTLVRRNGQWLIAAHHASPRS